MFVLRYSKGCIRFPECIFYWCIPFVISQIPVKAIGIFQCLWDVVAIIPMLYLFITQLTKHWHWVQLWLYFTQLKFINLSKPNINMLCDYLDLLVGQIHMDSTFCTKNQCIHAVLKIIITNDMIRAIVLLTFTLFALLKIYINVMNKGLICLIVFFFHCWVFCVCLCCGIGYRKERKWTKQWLFIDDP